MAQYPDIRSGIGRWGALPAVPAWVAELPDQQRDGTWDTSNQSGLVEDGGSLSMGFTWSLLFRSRESDSHAFLTIFFVLN